MARWETDQKSLSLSANLVAARTLSLEARDVPWRTLETQRPLTRHSSDGKVQSRLLSPALHQRAGRICMRMQLEGFDPDQINAVVKALVAHNEEASQGQ